MTAIPFLNGFTADWSTWVSSTAGDGAITISAEGRKATMSASGGNGRALMRHSFVVLAGSKWTMRCQARAVSGAGYIGADVISGLNASSVEAEEKITSPHWMDYEISNIAESVGNGETVDVYVGARTNIDGVLEVKNVSITVESDLLGVERILARGFINIVGGGGSGSFTIARNRSWHMTGIKGITRVDANTLNFELSAPWAEILGSDDDHSGTRAFPWGQFVDTGEKAFNPNFSNWPNADSDPKRNSMDMKIVQSWPTAGGGYVNLDALSGTLYLQFAFKI